MTATVQETQSTPQETTKTADVNFANMRKALEAERAEKAKMQERLTELEKMAKQAPVPRNDDDEFGDEPYIDPRTFKKKMAKFEESLEQKIEQKAEAKARQLIEEHQRNSYLKQNSDFEPTMAPEMIQRFAEKHPEMAEAILRMPDGFERQRLVYEAIKSTGTNKPEEAKPSIQQKIDQNRRSPYYIPSSSGTAPYNGVGDFSEAGQKNAYAKLKELKGRLRLG